MRSTASSKTSAPRVNALVSAALALGTGAALVFTCCRDASDGNGDAGSAAAANETGGATGGMASPVGGAGVSAALPGGAGTGGSNEPNGAAGYWSPTGNPEWVPVDWAPDCLIEAAASPGLAMPELEWKPCEVLPGCERFDPNWYVKSQISLGFAAGYRRGKEALLGLGTSWGDGTEWRSAVYAADWKPVAVWRGKSNDCNGVSPRPTPENVCFRSAKVGGGAKGGLFSTDNLTTPTTTFATNGRLSMSCGAGLSIGFDTAGRNYIFDVSKGQDVELVVPSGEAFQPEAKGSTAYFSRSYLAPGSKEALDGWIWTSNTGAARLIDPGDKFVADLRSDGTNLIWLELDMTTIDHAASGSLWMSPLADTLEGVQRHLVRDVPSASITAFQKVAGGGFYAMIEQHDDQNVLGVHVYRLEDGRHWQVTLPDDLIPSTLVWVDTDELLIATALPSGASHGLVRQKLSELGAGD